MLSPEQTARVRALNDLLRQGRASGRMQITAGVLGLGDGAVTQAISAVAAFDEFNAANDPYGEHDFGAIQVQGQQLFWKIDYYAPGFEGGSLDPSDEGVCVRVLTLMLAEEY